MDRGELGAQQEVRRSWKAEARAVLGCVWMGPSSFNNPAIRSAVSRKQGEILSLMKIKRRHWVP